MDFANAQQTMKLFTDGYTAAQGGDWQENYNYLADDYFGWDRKSSAQTGLFYYVSILLLLSGLFQLIKRILLKMGAEYVVTNKKVILKSGILNRDALELVLNKCEGIRINQSLMGRMLGFGSIVVTTGGVTNKFDFITNPIKFRNEINAQIQ